MEQKEDYTSEKELEISSTPSPNISENEDKVNSISKSPSKSKSISRKIQSLNRSTISSIYATHYKTRYSIVQDVTNHLASQQNLSLGSIQYASEDR